MAGHSGSDHSWLAEMERVSEGSGLCYRLGYGFTRDPTITGGRRAPGQDPASIGGWRLPLNKQRPRLGRHEAPGEAQGQVIPFSSQPLCVPEHMTMP